MTINFYQSSNFMLALGGEGTSGTNTAYSLDSNFELGVGGDCVGIRFVAPPGGVHVHSVYFFLDAANASSHDLICHLAGYNSASVTRANTTSIRSVNAAGGTTADKWIKFDFSAFEDALTAGDIYWAVAGDAAGTGSGYQIRTRNSSIISVNNSIESKLFYMYSNDAGFTTNGTAIPITYSAIIVFSDGSVIGSPYTQNTGSASNTLERGLKFIFDEKITCAGVTMNLASANASTLQVLSEGTAPGGSAWSGFNGGNAYTMTAGQKVIGGVQFPSPVTFEKNTYYRLTIRSTDNHTYPGYSEVEDYATLESAALNTLLGAGSWCYTIDNGAGGWIDYNNATNGYRLPRMSLILQSQVAITGGGGNFSFGG